MSREAHLSAHIDAEAPALGVIDRVSAALDRLTRRPTDVKLRLDASTVQSGLDRLIQGARSLQRASTAVRVTANTTEAKQKLTEITTIVNGLGRRREIVIGAKFDFRGAQSEMDGLLRRARSLQRSSSAIQIGANTTEATRRVTAFLTLIRQVPRTLPITVRVDGGQGVRDLGALVAHVRDLRRNAGAVVIRIDTGPALARLTQLRNTLNQIHRAGGRLNITVAVNPGSQQSLNRLRSSLEVIKRLASTITIRIAMPPGLLNELTQAARLFTQATNQARRLQAVLGAAGGRIGSFLQSFGGLTSVPNLLRGIWSAAGGYIVFNLARQAIEATAHAVLNFNSISEKALIGFQTMLGGSAQAAQTFYKDLQKFSLATPFEFKDLLPLAGKIKAFGFSLQETIPILRAVGDHSAAFGGSAEVVDRIILALGQIRGLGKLQGAEIRQLANAYVDVYKYIGQAIGKTTKETAALVKTGTIDGVKAVKAIISGMEREYGGMMNRLALTLDGGISNLKDAFSIFAAETFKPVYDALTRLIVRTAWFAQNKEVQTWVQDVVTWISSGFKLAGESAEWSWNVIKTVAPLVIGALTGIGLRALWVGRVAIGSGLISGIRAAITALGAWVTAMAAAGGAQVLMAGIVGAALAALATDFLGIRSKLVDGWKEVTAWIARQYDAVVGFLNRTFGTQLEGGFEASVKVTMPAVDSVFADWKNNLKNQLKSVTGELSGAMTGLFPAMPDWGKLSKEADQFLARTRGPKAAVAPYTFDPSGGDGDEKKKRAALRALQDALGDASKAWRDYAKAVTEAANVQIEKLKATRDSVIGFVQTLESRLIDAGGRGLTQFYKMVDGLRSRMGADTLIGGIATTANREARRAEGMAQGYESRKERNAGLDGVVPSKVAGSAGIVGKAGGAALQAVEGAQMSSAAGARVAREAEAMLSRSAITAAGQCLRWVQDVLDNPGVLKRAELATMRRSWGMGSAAATGNSLLQRGLARTASAAGALRPGDVVFKLRGSGGDGHAAIYAGNGLFAENTSGKKAITVNGANGYRTAAKFGRYDAVYRPGGFDGAANVAVGLKAVASGAAGTGTGAAESNLPSVASSAKAIKQVKVPNAANYERLVDLAKNTTGLSATWTKYNTSSLSDLLKLQPKATDTNTSRRESLLFLAEQNKGMSDWAKVQAQKLVEAGKLKAKDADGWAAKQVASIRAAIYAIANLTDAESNQAKAEKAGTDAQTERRAEIAKTSQTLRDRLKLLQFEAALSRGMGDQERADALEVEGNRQERINSLLEKNKGLSKDKQITRAQAEAIATSQAALEGQVKAQERLNTKVREEIAARREAAQAYRDNYKSALDDFRGSLQSGQAAKNQILAEMSYRRANPNASDEDVESHLAVRNAALERYVAILRAGAPVLGYWAALQAATVAGNIAANQEKQNQALAKGLRLLKDIATVRTEAGRASDLTRAETRLIDGGATPEKIEQAKKSLTRLAELERLRREYQGDKDLPERERLLAQGWNDDDAREAAQKRADERGRVVEYLNDLSGRLNAARQSVIGKGGVAGALDDIRAELRRAKWSEADIATIIPRARMVLETEEAARQMSEALAGVKEQFSGILSGVQKDGIGHFDKMFSGILDRFYQWADQMLSNAIWQQVSGLFTDLVGGFFGAKFGAATPGVTGIAGPITSGLRGSGGGLFGGGSSLDSGFSLGRASAAGLANLQDVTAYRATRRSDALSAAQVGAMSVSSAGRSAGPTVQVMGDLHVNEAKRPRDTVRGIMGAARSTGEMQRAARLQMIEGDRGL